MITSLLNRLYQSEPSLSQVQAAAAAGLACVMAAGLCLAAQRKMRKRAEAGFIDTTCPVEDNAADPVSIVVPANLTILRRLRWSAAVAGAVGFVLIPFACFGYVFRTNVDDAIQRDFVRDPIGAMLALRKAERTPFGRRTVYLYMARQMMNSGRFNAAIPLLRNSIRFQANTEAYALLGQILYKEGSKAEAADCFSKAVELSPASPITLLAYGECLEGANRTGEAYAIYQKAASIDARDYRPRMRLGALLIEHGHIDEGLANCRKAVELGPFQAETHFYLATAYGAIGLYNAAVAEFQRTVELNHEDVDAQYRLGVTLSKLNENKRAAQALKACINLPSKTRSNVATQGSARRMLVGLDPSNVSQ